MHDLSQVLGQCKGVISAIVSVLIFRNIVPAFGWIGYGATVVGCIAYGRCKAHFRKDAAQLPSADDQRWLAQVQEDRTFSGNFGQELEAQHSGGPFHANGGRTPPGHEEQRLQEGLLAQQQQQQHQHQFSDRLRAHAEAESLGVASDNSDDLSADDGAQDARQHMRHTNHERLQRPLFQGGSGIELSSKVGLGASDGTQPASLSQVGSNLTLKSMHTSASLRSMIAAAVPGGKGDGLAWDAMSEEQSPDRQALLGSHALQTVVHRHEGQLERPLMQSA